MNKETSEREVGNRAFPDLPRAITSFGAAVVDDSIYVYGGHHGRAHHYSLTGQSGELLQLNLLGSLVVLLSLPSPGSGIFSPLAQQFFMAT